MHALQCITSISQISLTHNKASTPSVEEMWYCLYFIAYVKHHPELSYSMTYKQNVPDIAGRHQIWMDNAVHLCSGVWTRAKFCQARADKGEKGKYTEQS